jgi:signal transduction histidine kinase
VFAAACLLLAGANLRYLVAPALRIDWVTPQICLRLAAYCFLLAGAYVQHAKLRRAAASAAIASERERIARDLHDGLAQDLACIAAQGQRLDCELGPEHPLMVATRHALAASRGVIADLTAATAPTTEAALRIIADELEHRYDLQVQVRVETDAALIPDDELEPTQREHLIRIAREAIVNAATHGLARHVDVVLLRRPGTLLMRVSDDGRGISAAQESGFGLRSMRARAASLGGQLSAHPRADGGTDLELLVS